MKTAIVILNWNGYHDTVICLQSLLPHLGAEDCLFVVDNGSTDESVTQLHAFLSAQNFESKQTEIEQLNSSYQPSCKAFLVLNGQNLGFGAGINRLLRVLPQLQDDFKEVWLLNNDAVVEAATLVTLKAALRQNSKTGVVGSVILNFPDNGLIQCAGVKHHPFFGVSKLIFKNKPQSVLKEVSVIDFDYLNGASLLFNFNAVKEVGFFDERFFLYSEEYDLQLRLKQKGYVSHLALNSRVFHKLSGGTGNSRHLFFYYYNTSAILLSRKHFGLVLTCCATLNLIGITALRALPSFKNFSWGIKGIWKGLMT